MKGQNLVRGLGKETPQRDLGLTQKLLVLLSFEPSTLSGHLSRKDSNERQRNQGHISRGSTLGGHIDALITDKACYFKRDGAREYGADRYFLL